jgi:hypothetical protein
VVGRRESAIVSAEMKPEGLRTVGAVLLAMTLLVFVEFPRWMDTVVPYSIEALDRLPHPRLVFPLFQFLPLLVLAVLWIGFLIAWRFASHRSTPPNVRQAADRWTKAGPRLLLAAGVVAFAATVLVELTFTFWMTGVGIAYIFVQDYSPAYYYDFLTELPQLFVVLLWMALLLAAWLARPNSPVSQWPVLWRIALLLLAATALVWAAYPYWRTGTALATGIPHEEFAPAVRQTLEALPALSIACLWLCFSFYLISCFRSWKFRTRI